MSVLEERAVRAAYRHQPKLVRPGPSIALGDAVLKWYDIAPPEEPVTDPIRTLARGPARRAAPRRHAHERLSWSRYLFSRRDEEARRAYLRDTFAGVV